MRCNICPLYLIEKQGQFKKETCKLFNSWDSQFQYLNKLGVRGCYIEKCYIRAFKDTLSAGKQEKGR